MKKTIKKPAKKAVNKAKTINHIKPLEDMMATIQSSEAKLIKLVDSTLLKLEKLAKNAKTKVSKLSDKHKKINGPIKAMHAKHKAKPSKMIHSAIQNLEKSQSDAARLLECAKGEHAALQSQLATCKDMKKNAKAAKSHVTNTSKKPSAKRKKKAILSKPETTTPENSTVRLCK